MRSKESHVFRLLLVAALTLAVTPLRAASKSELRRSLTFFAGFDGSTSARFANGDPSIYTAKTINHPRVGTPGLPSDGSASIAKDQGRHGDALRFGKKSNEIVFFKAAKNMDYRQSNWSGTVSLWLKLSPDEDLEPGYVDPLQITTREWNDGTFFVDFSKDEKPRHFRLGMFSDYKAWNPTDRKWESFSDSERPMVTVTHPPFRRDRWTHVAFTFENLNTGKDNAIGRFYLDGKLQGELTGRSGRFTWETEKALMMLGIYYTGLVDEFAVFNQALTAKDIEKVRTLKKGIGELLK